MLYKDLFISKARSIYGDRFDYSKVNYVNRETKVTIICPEHGEFLQKPFQHLRANGCPKCRYGRISNVLRGSKESFIIKGIENFGDKYDYSKVDYINSNTKVIIICPEHGEFSQRPSQHIQGHGCPKCGRESAANSRKYSTEEFISKSRSIHGDKYDYSKVEYVDSRIEVTIICPEHGEFLQRPGLHLQGGLCPKCCSNHTLTSEEFVSKSRSIHGDKYDYSKVDYINNNTKVIIICPEHGEFLQRPGLHLYGRGCPKCGRESATNSRKYSTEEFISKSRSIHGDKYDYSKVDYINNNTEVTIICPEHGEFLQKPTQHIQGHGCPCCARNNIINSRRCSTEEFISKSRSIHGDKYDYSKVDYINSNTKVIIICPEHGEFLQRPAIHCTGSGCPLCSASTGELFIWEYLNTYNINCVFQYSFDGCRYKYPLKFDFYLPDYNMCIEFDGEQHFKYNNSRYTLETLEYSNKRDKIKDDYCKDNGIKLLRISYEDQDRIEEILKKELNLC